MIAASTMLAKKSSNKYNDKKYYVSLINVRLSHT